MRDIIALVEANYLHITRWAARLGELSRLDSGQQPIPVLVRTWQTLTSLIELHIRADEEICGPAIFGPTERGRVLARETRAAHEDIREIIREACRLDFRHQHSALTFQADARGALRRQILHA